jgi:transcriptional regulator with XRE-family HTH domain
VLLGFDQRQLAELSGLSVPTIQRMEASETVVRGNVDSLMKLIAALDLAGIEIIQEGAISKTEGRGVRLKARPHTATADVGDRSNVGTSRSKRARK